MLVGPARATGVTDGFDAIGKDNGLVAGGIMCEGVYGGGLHVNAHHYASRCLLHSACMRWIVLVVTI